MAKSKLTQENKNKIYNLLSEGQTQKSVCRQLDINEKTFFNWINKYTDFADLVEKAKQEYRDSRGDRIKEVAQQKIDDLVEHGHIVKVTRTSKTKTIRRYPVYKREKEQDGKEKVVDEILWWKIGFEDETENTDITETNFGVPQWALDRILPPAPKNIEEAVKLLELYGLSVVVNDSETFKKWVQTENDRSNLQGTNRGLSEEFANQIRARILGVSEDASDISEVSTEVGDRQQ